MCWLKLAPGCLLNQPHWESWMPFILGKDNKDFVWCGCGLIGVTFASLLCQYRMGASDLIQCCKSTFMVELQVTTFLHVCDCIVGCGKTGQ